MFKIVLTTVEEVLFTGDRQACENVMRAFLKYNGATNIVMRGIHE
jgi:hypothetical protein